MTQPGNDFRGKLLITAVVGVALGYFEAAIVVYLRELFYRDGFSFPLTVIPTKLLIIEIGREIASLVLIAAIAILAAKRAIDRLGYFLILFGVWDISYYLWLKVTIGWPVSIFDWDILFLIPLPWIGPVIAPVLIACLMVGVGVSLVSSTHRFRSPSLTAGLVASGTAIILYSFMHDTAATLHQQMPLDYQYWLLGIGLILYLAAYRLANGSFRPRRTADN
jgi:hypothetical protein